ncbi:cold-shock protein [Pedobacter nototheniae]|uniref:cold-shock protein n=1 Tax=Pedobacter nototheniae TaxID=2488994 RepID=UPI00103D6162|nr:MULTISPECIES: cold shock domain-containing protein [Pedobacter]
MKTLISLKNEIMPIGIVKWYDSNRGFGFISTEDEEEVIFADSEKIIDGAPEELKEGIYVDYQISCTENGRQAINIKILFAN